MRIGGLRLDMRIAALCAGATAMLLAVLIVWLGHRQDAVIDRLVAEGRLAQGEYLSTDYGSRSDGASDQVHVSYVVDGTKYYASMVISGSTGRKPIFENEVIPLPRLGEEKLFQVVYLPSDPSIARLRADISKSRIAVYGTAGMFLFIGLFIIMAGVFVFPAKRRRPNNRPA